MTTKHRVHNLIILDESGSMQSIKEDIIKGFNEVVQTIKGVEKQYPDQEHFISILTFNGLGQKYLLENMPVSKLEEIDGNRYQPNAMTPLYDAMGFSIQQLRNQLSGAEDYHVLVTVLTDGEENSSREFDAKAIKALVDDLSVHNWTFTYIGTEHDVSKSATTISIHNTIIFKKDKADMERMFTREKNARIKYSRDISEDRPAGENFYGEA
ncbi:MAG: VWA domain-containing protein [Bacteroidales bacterium]|jgi:uncharacterized protein YegL|nr:VWA domain-containing protein [Bacteroidales bacterium]